MLDLLADRAACGLSTAEEIELRSLGGDQPEWSDESLGFERAAAALAEALTPLDELLPAAVRERFRQSVAARPDVVATLPEVKASEAAGGSGPGALGERAAAAGPRRSPLAWTGWVVAAAACVALVASVAVTRSGSAPGDPAVRRRAFIAEHPGAAQVTWSPWVVDGLPPEQSGVSGDVVWSEEEGAGYLRLVGLAPNDPRVEQYQLWIVDERGLFDETGQSARISGAIFDADSDGETIVRIDPSIPVRNAAAFAVTIEEPGGVWVSDMERRTVIAALGG